MPLFPLAARLRCEPDLHHEATAVVVGNGSTAHIIAASRKARRAGVRPGMTLPQARARCPKLIARARDAECENTAREVLLEIAESFSPRVEESSIGIETVGGATSGVFNGISDGLFDGVVYLDIDGLERHYRKNSAVSQKRSAARTNNFEHELGAELMRQLDDAGLPVKVGIASSKLAARVAANLAITAPPPPDEPGAVIDREQARARIAPKVVAAGEEALFLAPLPLHRLSPHAETAQTLQRWGIERVGDFAQLPKAQVRSRLGELGARLHQIARGIDPRPLIARTPTPNLREGMSLEWPIANLEPFLFVAQAALERLCDRLARKGLGCKRLEMSLQLEPEGFHERSIELPSPTREAKTLLTLVRLDLEAHTPTAPILRFQFTAQPDAPRLAQMSLFGPTALSPDGLATTIARLFALLGPQRVGSPRPAPGHAPERFALVEYTPPPPPKVRRKIEPGRGLLAVRVLRPPVELEVATEASESQPTADSSRDEQTMRPLAEEFVADGFHQPDTNSSTKSNESVEIQEVAETSRLDEYRAALVRESDSGADRRSFSEIEGMERQNGLFRPSRRCAQRPYSIESKQAPKANRAKDQSSNGRRPATPVSPSNAPSNPGPPSSPSSPSSASPGMQIRGHVRVASGPWELEEKWWLEERTERDYWDVELASGTLFRIYRDRTNGRWFADGIYD